MIATSEECFKCEHLKSEDRPIEYLFPWIKDGRTITTWFCDADQCPHETNINESKMDLSEHI